MSHFGGRKNMFVLKCVNDFCGFSGLCLSEVLGLHKIQSHCFFSWHFENVKTPKSNLKQVRVFPFVNISVAQITQKNLVHICVKKLLCGKLKFDPNLKGFFREQIICRILRFLQDCLFKVEIILEQRQLAFLSPSKICENLNF